MRAGLLRDRRRAVIDLGLAFGVGFAVLLLSVAVNLGQPQIGFMRGLSSQRVTHVLVNGLFVWLAVLLWASFFRWRGSARRKEELEDALSSISPDGLIVITPARRITLCNPAIERVFGYSEAEALGQSTDLLYSDRRSRGRASPHEIYEALEKDGFHVGTATGKRKDGTTLPIEVISGEMAGDAGAVLVLRDISERVRAEEERQRLEARTEQSRRLQNLGALAGGIAHDLNNQLMIVEGNLELALKNLVSASPASNFLQEIEKATARAAELCRQLLSFSGGNPSEFCDVDLSRICRETGELLRGAVGKATETICALADGLPPIRADISQIRQVLMNLITNAAEAIGDKRGKIEIATGTRQCAPAYLSECAFAEGASPGCYAYLRIADSGHGMDEETKRRIFEPFFTTKDLGHGMGLAAILGIVRKHRGCMRVESKPGAGAVFTVLFPCAEATAA